MASYVWIVRPFEHDGINYHVEVKSDPEGWNVRIFCEGHYTSGHIANHEWDPDTLAGFVADMSLEELSKA